MTGKRGRFLNTLSGRFLMLTVAFVMLAEVLIFVPSIANFRNNWLSERLAQARAAALVLEKTPADALPAPDHVHRIRLVVVLESAPAVAAG